MTVVELSSLLSADASARVLDVRTPAEFENAHITGAYNVPLDQLQEHAREVRQARGPVVLICQSGKRAQQAEQVLRGGGMANVHVLDGGMKDWIALGMPVNQVRPRVSLERQVRMTAGTIVAIGSILALTVSPLFVVVPLLIGSGLVFSGATDTCAMGMLIAKLPYNRRTANCDTEVIVRQFLA